ncbi:hypothetical protein NOR53_2806 [gamma proteobacterium NOR5-3]|nr:hypothetical protein NOR53_2806 [gamma proteobacterium NOR5-3]
MLANFFLNRYHHAPKAPDIIDFNYNGVLRRKTGIYAITIGIEFYDAG